MASSRILPLSYNEKTYGTALAGRDYTSLSIWESDTDNNLVTATKGEVLTCYDDSTSYADKVVFNGATTSSSYFRVVRAASGKRGTSTSGVRFTYSSGVEDVYMFAVQEDYSSIYDIALTASCTLVNGRAYGFLLKKNNITSGCTAYNLTATNGAYAHAFGFYAYTVENATNYFINCYATGCSGSAAHSSGFYLPSFSSGVTMTNYLYNCTAVSNKNGVGYYADPAGSVTIVNAKNVISQGNTSNAFYDVGGGGTRTLNQTTNATTLVQFKSNGYDLRDDYAGNARNKGTNLSADGTFPFDDDINGNTITRGWQIGCSWPIPIQSNTGLSAKKLPAYYYESSYGGASRGYTSLQTWEDQTTNNLATQGVGEVLTCYADSSTYNDSVIITGATVDSNNFRCIRAAEGHYGRRNKGVRFEKSATANFNIFYVQEQYFSLYNIGMKIQTTTAGIGLVCVRMDPTANYSKIVGCYLYDCLGMTTGYMIGIYGANVNNVKIINCVIDNLATYNPSGSFMAYTSGIWFASSNTNITNYVYNCTIKNTYNRAVNCSAAAGYSSTIYVKNTISQDNTQNFVVYVKGGTETITQENNLIDQCILNWEDSKLIKYSNIFHGNATRSAWMSACNSYDANFLPSNSFQGTNNTIYSWVSANGTVPNVNGSCWIQINCQTQMILSRMRIQNRFVTVDTGCNQPRSVGIFGSNTGLFSGEETLLFSGEFNQVDYLNRRWTNWVRFTTIGSFQYYRMRIYTGWQTATYTTIGQIEFELAGDQLVNPAIGTGLDLSNTGGYSETVYPFNDDINGNTRDVWDVGAYKYNEFKPNVHNSGF